MKSKKRRKGIQECFRDSVYKEKDFPVSEESALKTMGLPIHPELEEGQIAYVFDIISGFMEKNWVVFFWSEPRKSLDN